MIFKVVFTIAVHLVIIEALIPEQDLPEVRKTRNYKKLINFINLLNAHDKSLQEPDDGNFVKEMQDIGAKKKNRENLGNEVDINLQDILRVIQKNYDAQDNKGNSMNNGFIYISNPEVIEEYRNGINKDSAQAFDNRLRRKIERSSSSSSDTSSDSDMRRNLKDILQNIRKKDIPLTSNGDFAINRRNQKNYSQKENDKASMEKATWKDISKEKPREKKKDLSNAFHREPSWNKRDYRPRKRPVGYQAGAVKKFDSYRPKKEDYLKRREDYRSYGRTPIPIVGKKAVYDKK